MYSASILLLLYMNFIVMLVPFHFISFSFNFYSISILLLPHFYCMFIIQLCNSCSTFIPLRFYFYSILILILFDVHYISNPLLITFLSCFYSIVILICSSRHSTSILFLFYFYFNFKAVCFPCIK